MSKLPSTPAGASSRPPLSCRTSPPQGGRLAVATALPNRLRHTVSSALRGLNHRDPGKASDLPPCGGDVRQDRGGRRRAPSSDAPHPIREKARP